MILFWNYLPYIKDFENNNLALIFGDSDDFYAKTADELNKKLKVIEGLRKNFSMLKD